MSRLLAVEMRRDLSRRLTWVLLGVATLVIVIMGIAVFATVEDVPSDIDTRIADARAERRADVRGCVQDLQSSPEFAGPGVEAFCDDQFPPVEVVDPEDPAFLVALWPDDGETEGTLLLAATFLPMGALIAGASMVGGEWRAQTMTTLLTWEPRRVRVMLAKLGSAGILATALGAVLLALFSVAFLPAVFLKGSTDTADASWFSGYLAAIVRIATVTGLAAVLGAAIANLGRNTGAALGAAFAWMAVIEPVIRALRPGARPWLLAENVGRFVTARPLEGAEITRSTAGAFLVLVLYVGSIAAISVWQFRRRDVAGAA